MAETAGSRRRAADPSAGEELPSDHDTLDLARSLVDLKHLRVPHQLLDRVLAYIAVPSEHLHRVDRRLHRAVGAVGLGEARDDRIAHAVVEVPGRLLVEQ